ncbi:OLC1v1003002C1 [Oldenlandia corymbosa var. corymbosa]|uniref:OLC1v1003002C1 n=1 Tax=Oldenlandia corymbosa var. corymbosa TaxID=529605 RepID=A0AAV1DBF4_OLDCO|nr:OLC1v1003002C1 [Oldenlandia corymbosa var. corymbosa]
MKENRKKRSMTEMLAQKDGHQQDHLQNDDKLSSESEGYVTKVRSGTSRRKPVYYHSGTPSSKAGRKYHPLGTKRYAHRISPSFEKVPHGYEVSSHVIKRAKEIEANLDSRYPCFKKIMLHTHVDYQYRLNLPMLFAKKNMPIHDAMCILEDEDGELYETMFCPGDKLFFRAGWKNFVIDHKLLEGDAVVFQLIAPCKFKVFIVRSPTSGEVDRTSVLSQVDESINGQESGEQLIKEKEKDASEHEKSDVFVDFQNFSVVFEGVALDSDFKVPDIRRKYYELCLSQKSFLHAGLVKAISRSSVVDIISDTVRIANDLKGSTFVTSISKFKLWDQTLGGFEILGMKVGFLRAHASKLICLEEQVEDTPTVKKYKEAMIQYDLEGEKMMSIEAKLREAQQEREKLRSEFATLNKQIQAEGSRFLKEANAPW